MPKLKQGDFTDVVDKGWWCAYHKLGLCPVCSKAWAAGSNRGGRCHSHHEWGTGLFGTFSLLETLWEGAVWRIKERNGVFHIMQERAGGSSPTQSNRHLNCFLISFLFLFSFWNQVVQRIFYTVNRSWSGKITSTEIRKSNFLQVCLSHKDT